MSKYHEFAKALCSIESFDQKAFTGDERWSQAICDLVLVFAVAYNDFKDVLMAHVLLTSAAPPGPPAETPPWGQYNGLRIHLTRIQAAFVFELLEVIRSNGLAVHSDPFKALLKKLPANEREAWEALEDVAFQRATSRPLAEALQFIRNKVAYHYDTDQISGGYRAAFSTSLRGEPRLSRGNDLASTRFYFADAAAGDTYMGLTTTKAVSDFLTGDLTLLSHIHHALYHLVTAFIQARGCGWRTPRT